MCVCACACVCKPRVHTQMPSQHSWKPTWIPTKDWGPSVALTCPQGAPCHPALPELFISRKCSSRFAVKISPLSLSLQ